MKVGYYSDLMGLTFGGTPERPTSWVHALPGGTYQHPVYGELRFSDDRIQNFADSVTKKFRKVEPDIDYDHKQDTAMGNKAAGWVKAAESRPKGTTHKDFADSENSFNNDLWLFVEWTPPGAQAIKNGEWRYFSSELTDEWTDENGTTYKDVLFGGGITNRPYMKELLPLNLSELTFKSVDAQPNKGEQVDGKKLRASLNLSEDVSDAVVDAKLAELMASKPADPPNKSLSELLKLAESNPLVAQLMETQKQNTQALKEMQDQLKLSETTRRLGDLTGPTAKVQFSAASLNTIRDIMIAAPTALAEQIFTAFQSIASGEAIVSLGELGSGSGGNITETGKSATERFNELVQKHQVDGKSYADAVEAAAFADRALWDEYRTASYIKPKGA